LCFFDTGFRFELPQLEFFGHSCFVVLFQFHSQKNNNLPPPRLSVCHACGLCTHLGSEPINHNIKTVPNPATPPPHTTLYHMSNQPSSPSFHYPLPTFPILSPPPLLLLLLTARACDPVDPSSSTAAVAITRRRQPSQAAAAALPQRAAPTAYNLCGREGCHRRRREVIDLLAAVVSGCAGLQSILVCRLLVRDAATCPRDQKGSARACYIRVVVYRSRCCANN
jgi:hypothetical protein